MSSASGSGTAADRPWLVAIDLQNIFADPESGWATPGFADALAGTTRLLPAFEGRTLLTRFVAPGAPTGAWLRYYQDWPFALVPEDSALYRLVDDVAELGLPVETRTTFGKWDAALGDAIGGARELVLTGVSTDCCVLSTALAAADAGVHVRVVTDACAGLSPKDHQRALDAMSLYAPLIELTTTKDLLAEAATAEAAAAAAAAAG